MYVRATRRRCSLEAQCAHCQRAPLPTMQERRGPREAELKKEFEIQRGVYELEVQQFREAVLTSFAEKAAVRCSRVRSGATRV